MPNVKYDAAMHQKAFEIWVETKTYASVQSELQLDFGTVKAWSGVWACPFACPYHNWEQLDAERAKALSSQLTLYSEGIIDPIAHDKAIRDAMDIAGSMDPNVSLDENAAPGDTFLEKRTNIVKNLVRSDIERITHWELLYSKAFFQLTGVRIDYRTLMRNGEPLSPEQFSAEFLEKGMKLRSFESGIKALATIQEKIEELKRNLGVYGQKTPQEQIEDLTNSDNTKRAMNIEDIRKMQALIANTSPEQLEALKLLAMCDEETFASLTT